MYIVRLLIVCLVGLLCEGYKILVVFPHPARSHGNLGDALVQLLLKAGHQVTYITPFVSDKSQQNLTYVDASETRKAYVVNLFGIEQLMKKELKMDQHVIFHLMKRVSELALENENVKKFLENSTESFDVVIAEWMFNELYSGFAAVYKCPYIWVFPFEPNFVALSLMGESTNPAYAANLELNFKLPLSFLDRIRNFWFQLTYRLQYYYWYDSIERGVYDKAFAPILLKKHGSTIPYDVIRYNASLMLAYSHYSLGQALTIPQNLIPVGGYHIDYKTAPLPKNLKKILDDAKEGVIYFSMGSNLKSEDFPKYILDGLITLFGSLKHKVLWKFEGDITVCPENVHILKWAPQQSILAHPNCILFITHGGLLSSTEAVHFGVPIIGIPVYFDQFSNVDRAVERGYAKKVVLSPNFVDDLKLAIEDILNDVKYEARAKELSFIYHDRPVPPGVSLVHWVEHVAATNGAPYLRSPALLVPWYQKYYLDFAVIVLLVLVCVIYCLKMLVSKYRKNKTVKIKKKVT